MKPKNLVPLAIILVVLTGLVLLRQSGRETATLTEQVQLTALVPEDLDRDDIARIELHAGGKADETLVLEKESAGDNWILLTHYDSPVLQTKVDELFDVLIALKGEYRATPSTDGLDAYDLGDETAFHVKGFAAGASEPLFHVLTGKAPTFGDAFARAAGGEDVYVIDKNIRREAGIYTLDLSDPPEPGFWLNKKVLDLESDAIKRLALNYPDKALAFEYQEVVPEEEADADEPAADEAEPEESGEEAADEPDPAPDPTYEWVVTSGGTGEELNTSALRNLTRRLAGLNASDIVDPENTAEWKLDSPEYVCRLGVEGQDDEIILEAGRPTDDRYGYVRIASAEKNLVYKISGYDFEQIFAEGGKFFELPGILVDEVDVDRIEYTTEEGKVALGRSDDTWIVLEPSSDAELLEGKLDTIVRTVLSWKATDYADSVEGTGLDGEPAAVTITGEGVSHTIAVAEATPSENGFYARLDTLDQVLVMSERNQDQIFVAPSSLFRLDIFEVDESAISSVELTQGESAISLARGEGGWMLTAGEDTVEADESTADDLAAALSVLKAEKLHFDGGVPGEMIGSVSFKTDDDEEFSFDVYSEQDGLNLLRLPGRETGYWIESTYMERLFPGVDTLKKPEPPAEDAAEEDVTGAETSGEEETPETP